MRTIRELSEILDLHLGSRSWLVGDEATIADFAVASWIPVAAPTGVSLDAFGAVMRWFASVEVLLEWQEALPPAPRIQPSIATDRLSPTYT